MTFPIEQNRMNLMLQVEETLAELVIKDDPKLYLGDSITLIEKCLLELR
ncbi:MAG: hypothetical protein ACXADY_21490 [Candidatus Hodarchaeales archaeon]|jgi:hypothetical protein